MASKRPNPKNEVRLQRYLASCGAGSRRACEQLIADGRVAVDGEVVRAMGVSVDSSQHRITLDGRVLSPEKYVYYRYWKPAGVVCTAADPQGRPTCADAFRHVPERVFHVGRLDADSEGLLLMTNDGELAHRIAHPRHHLDKTYRVRLDRCVQEEWLDRWRAGIEEDGETLCMKSVELLDVSEALYRIVLVEGRKRQIRRMVRAAGREVIRLLRIRIGPLELGDLQPGDIRPLTHHELSALKAAVGLQRV